MVSGFAPTPCGVCLGPGRATSGPSHEPAAAAAPGAAAGRPAAAGRLRKKMEAATPARGAAVLAAAAAEEHASGMASFARGGALGNPGAREAGEVAALRAQLGQLTTDFRYNLQLLADRDAELEKLEGNLASCRSTLVNKEVDLVEARRGLAETEGALTRERARIAEVETFYKDKVERMGRQVEDARRDRDEGIFAERRNAEALEERLQKEYTEKMRQVEEDYTKSQATMRGELEKSMAEAKSLVGERDSETALSKARAKDLENLYNESKRQEKLLEQQVDELATALEGIHDRHRANVQQLEHALQDKEEQLSVAQKRAEYQIRAAAVIDYEAKVTDLLSNLGAVERAFTVERDNNVASTAKLNDHIKALETRCQVNEGLAKNLEACEERLAIAHRMVAELEGKLRHANQVRENLEAVEKKVSGMAVELADERRRRQQALDERDMKLQKQADGFFKSLEEERKGANEMLQKAEALNVALRDELTTYKAKAASLARAEDDCKRLKEKVKGFEKTVQESKRNELELKHMQKELKAAHEVNAATKAAAEREKKERDAEWGVKMQALEAQKEREREMVEAQKDREREIERLERERELERQREKARERENLEREREMLEKEREMERRRLEKEKELETRRLEKEREMEREMMLKEKEMERERMLQEKEMERQKLERDKEIEMEKILRQQELEKQRIEKAQAEERLRVEKAQAEEQLRMEKAQAEEQRRLERERERLEKEMSAEARRMEKERDAEARKLEQERDRLQKERAEERERVEREWKKELSHMEREWQKERSHLMEAQEALKESILSSYDAKMQEKIREEAEKHSSVLQSKLEEQRGRMEHQQSAKKKFKEMKRQLSEAKGAAEDARAAAVAAEKESVNAKLALTQHAEHQESLTEKAFLKERFKSLRDEIADSPISQRSGRGGGQESYADIERAVQNIVTPMLMQGPFSPTVRASPGAAPAPEPSPSPSPAPREATFKFEPEGSAEQMNESARCGSGLPGGRERAAQVPDHCRLHKVDAGGGPAFPPAHAGPGLRHAHSTDAGRGACGRGRVHVAPAVGGPGDAVPADQRPESPRLRQRLAGRGHAPLRRRGDGGPAGSEKPPARRQGQPSERRLPGRRHVDRQKEAPEKGQDPGDQPQPPHQHPQAHGPPQPGPREPRGGDERVAGSEPGALAGVEVKSHRRRGE